MSEVTHEQTRRAITSFGRFFSDQAAEAESGRRQTVALAVLLAGALGAILLILGSVLLVWVYAGILYFFFGMGVWRLNETNAATADSARHLEQIADMVDKDLTREEFDASVHQLVTQNNDRSNVPEAVEAMCQGAVSAGTARLASHTAFARPLADLEKASFLRMTLVLGGLFGTVFFFALELRASSFSGTNLGSMLEGLRGALASTLTGIACSVIIGIIASRLSGKLNRLIWKTETLFSIIVGSIVGRRHVKDAARSEFDLWQALQEEVAELIDCVNTQSQKMTDDTHAYTLALEAVSKQLRELPEVRVPEELGELSDSVVRFTDGANILGQAIPLLVEAVGAVGGIIPAKLLKDVDLMRGELTDVKKALEPIPVLADKLRNSADRVDSAADRVSSSADKIEGAAWEIIKGSEEVKQTITGVEKKVGAMKDDVTVLSDEVALTRGDVAQLREDLGDLPSRKGKPGLLKQLQDQVRALDGVIRWHERVRRAPIMRLLSAPLWAAWRRRRG